MASEVLQEAEEVVRWPVAAGFAVRWGGGVERSLFELEVGIEVDLGGGGARMPEP